MTPPPTKPGMFTTAPNALISIAGIVLLSLGPWSMLAALVRLAYPDAEYVLARLVFWTAAIAGLVFMAGLIALAATSRRGTGGGAG
jgi:hypothetical protein